MLCTVINRIVDVLYNMEYDAEVELRIFWEAPKVAEEGG